MQWILSQLWMHWTPILSIQICVTPQFFIGLFWVRFGFVAPQAVFCHLEVLKLGAAAPSFGPPSGEGRAGSQAVAATVGAHATEVWRVSKRLWELMRSKKKKDESFGMFQGWCFQSYFLLCSTFKFVEQHWLCGLFRQAGLLCASRTQVALDSGDPQRAEGWIQRSWPQLGRGVWWQVDQPFVFQQIWSTVPDLPSSEVANPSRSSTLRGAGVAPNSNAGIKFWEEGSMGSKTFNWSLQNVKMYGASDFFLWGLNTSVLHFPI